MNNLVYTTYDLDNVKRANDLDDAQRLLVEGMKWKGGACGLPSQSYECADECADYYVWKTACEKLLGRFFGTNMLDGCKDELEAVCSIVAKLKELIKGIKENKPYWAHIPLEKKLEVCL